MMHRLSLSRINDASIIWPPHQWCIDYVALASLMHRLSGPRIIDASIMPRPHQRCIDYWCINDASKWIEKNRFRSWCIKKNRFRSWCIKKNRFRSWCIKMDRYFLRQSVTGKNQIGGSRRRTTIVPGARASPLITCPGPLGGGTVGEDLERPSQSQSWNPGVNPNMRRISTWPSQPGDQSDNNDNLSQ